MADPKDERPDDDDDLLNAGFIDEEAAPTEPPSHPAQPAFDPFSDAGSLQSDLSGGVSPQPRDGMPASDGIDPVEAYAPGLGGDAPADEDIRPGQGKDLWKCPHCGAGNKPGRGTCRSCGKSPEDAVAHPLKKHIPLLIAAVVVAAILLLVISGGGSDFTLKPAGPQGLDDAPRTGGEPASVTIGEATFVGEERLAATGRVLSVSEREQDPRVVSVLLVFGDPAQDDAIFAELRPWEREHTVGLRSESEVPLDDLTQGLFHLVDPDGLLPATIERGDYLSVVGQSGTLRTLTFLGDPDKLRSFEYVVLVQQAQ